MADKITSKELTNLFQCHLCEKSYTDKRNLKLHQKKIHGIEIPQRVVHKVSHKIPCAEENCMCVFSTIGDLRNHLNEEHGFAFLEEYKYFSSIEQFHQWKRRLERSENARYIKTQGDKPRKNAVQQCFQCHRSGSYTSQSTGKRKARASLKIGHQCTANILTLINNVTGEVITKFVRKHYGHDVPTPFTNLLSNQRARTPKEQGVAMSLMKVRLITTLKTLIEDGGFDKVLDKLEVMSAGSGQCVCEMKVSGEHKNRNGLLHGGMTSTLVDAVSTMALFSKIEKPGVSVELSVSFLRSASVGDELFIEGKTLKVGKNLAFLSVDIKNKLTGQIIAQGKHTKFVGDQGSDSTTKASA